MGNPAMVHVERRGVAAPAPTHEPYFARNVLEPVAAQIAVENARFGAFGVEVAHERVAQTHIVAAGPPLVAGGHTHISHQEIEKAVAVKVEEHRAGGVAD